MRQNGVDDVLRYVADNDVKFIRLQFCDLNGTLRNVSVMVSDLERTLEAGFPLEAALIPGFDRIPQEGLSLFPDPATMAVLPWRPQHGRVLRLLCDVRAADGSPYAGDVRAICREAAAALAQKGHCMDVGLACCFTLLELDERGQPTTSPHDRAGAYAIAPQDKGENIRRAVCLTLEEMGIQPASSCHFPGPGQHEIRFHPAVAMDAADALITIGSVIRTTAAQNGLHATLMPKPFPDAFGNRLKLDLSLCASRMGDASPGERLPMPPLFSKGVEAALPSLRAFLNPIHNSYRRLLSDTPRDFFPADPLRPIELTTPDAAASPYLSFALLQWAGLNGMEGQPLPTIPPQEMPNSLADALRLARHSQWIRQAIGEDCFDAYLSLRESALAQQEETGDFGGDDEGFRGDDEGLRRPTS